MSKVKVKREVEGKATEIEVEESEILETDERISAPEPKKSSEKMLPQSQVDQLMSAERRKHREAYDALKAEYDEFRGNVEAEKKKANDEAEEKVKDLRKDLPDGVQKLLDKLQPIEQLAWLSDPANVIEKKKIEPLPKERSDKGAPPKVPVIV